jgi:hypothetical protein
MLTNDLEDENHNDKAARMMSCAHGTSECAEWKGFQADAGRLRHQYGRPEADTCCFRCLLPTRACRGPLLTLDGQACFSPDLIRVFWLIVHDYSEELVNDPTACLDPSLLPEAASKGNIISKRWELDTEMVLGALLFYRFAVSHSTSYGW